MKPTAAIRVLPVLLLLPAILGCNLADTLGGGKAELEPATPAVVYITATPQPTLPATAAPTAAPTATPTATLTPEPKGLTLAPCPDYPSDCPAAISASRFYEIAPPYEYTFDIPSATQLFVSTGWGAIDKATLEQNMPYVDFFLEIDGKDYYSDAFLTVVEEPDADVPARMNGIIYLNVVVTGWVPHEPHTLRVGYVTSAPLNDGWDDYDTGFNVWRILHVCPDGGCTTASSAAPGELSFTACPAAADCPDATNIYQYMDFNQAFTDEEIRVEVPYDKPLFLQTGFYVTKQSYLATSLPFIDFIFEVDGEDRFDESMVGVDTLLDVLNAEVTYYGNTIGVVLEGLELGKEYHVRFGYITTADLYDGKETVPAGSAMPLNYLIVPVE